MVAPKPCQDRSLVTLTADLVLFSHDRACVLCVLLVERGREPYAGWWALPGGRVEAGETAVMAARRELVEETGVSAPGGLTLVGVYDRPGRDPRGRVISAAYTGYLPAVVAPTAGDDAAVARWLAVDELGEGLAFDHAEILRAALAVHERG